MNKDSLRVIEKQADLSFQKGQVAGVIAKKIIKKTYIFLFVSVVSLVVSIFFFLYGFVDHKYKHPL